jgi:hypothetical protein
MGVLNPLLAVEHFLVDIFAERIPLLSVRNCSLSFGHVSEIGTVIDISICGCSPFSEPTGFHPLHVHEHVEPR